MTQLNSKSTTSSFSAKYRHFKAHQYAKYKSIYETFQPAIDLRQACTDQSEFDQRTVVFQLAYPSA